MGTSPVSAMETVSSPDILAMLVMAMLLTPTPPMEPLMPPLSTTSTRERLTLILTPTPSARLPLDFLMPTLLLPDMPTTLDTLPTPLSPPDLSTTPMLPSSPTDMASTVSTTVKHAAIRIPYNTKPNRIFQFKDVFQFINKC